MTDSTPTDSQVSPSYFLVRDERLSEIVGFSQLLARTIVSYAKGDVHKTTSIGINISTECPRCKIRLSGDELLAIGEAGLNEKSAKIQRMQLGYCARNSCDSSMFQVRFHRHPEVDWPAFLDEMNTCREDFKKASDVVMTAKQTELQKKQWRSLRRLGLGIAAIVLLLLVWQWRRGGRIPILREPEKFHVTPLPSGQKEHH